MGGFRGQRRVGAWLALIALALQLGLAFGHVHHEVHGRSAGLAAAWPDGDHGDADKDYCLCCAILNLLAGAQPGAVPTSAIPVWADAGIVSPAIALIRSRQARTAFRSRAPPLS
ncbi:MAG: hypothetical protein K2Y27_20870 [Xanthobacteraceae bacterium]|nr:hypothetical protein [Xanthobacteraceae bacterium]